MPRPPAAAIAAVLSNQSRITRRCEIYEQDGSTLWQPSMTPRMTDGSVSVDYSRSDRRNLDLTLDNSDGLISHNPKGGLWYDKIVKIYRGVRWENTKKIPTIALYDPDNNLLTVQFAQKLGFQVTRFTVLPTIDQIFSFDILLVIKQSGNFDANTSALMNNAYVIGINVFSLSPYATTTSVPILSATSVLSGATQKYTESTMNFGSPFTQVAPYTVTAATAAAYTLPTGAAAGAQTATTINFTSSTGTVTGFGLIYAQNANSEACWVHYSVPIFVGDANNSTSRRQRDRLLHSIFTWEYAYEKEQDWECQIGEFLISQIETPRAPRTIKITGIDYQKKCAESCFDNAISYNAGQKVDDLVRAIAANCGITKFRLNGGNAVTDTTYTFDSSSARWDAMAAMCTGANLEIFFDAEGYLVTRPFFDPSTSAPTFYLTTGEPDGNLVDWSEISDDSGLFNRICVSGTSPDSSITGNVYQGIAENHEPSSSTSIENLKRTKTYYYSSSFFTSNTQCLNYAKSLLAVHALENYQLSYQSVVFAWLEAGEIVEVDKPDTDPTDPTRFLNISFTIPLTLDAMSGTAKRITIVG